MRAPKKRRLCWVIPGVFATLFLLALTLFIVGTFGLFGAEKDPLSGVFLIPLGLPWNQIIDVFPERLWPWFAAAAPAVNLGILVLVCRRLSRPKDAAT